MATLPVVPTFAAGQPGVVSKLTTLGQIGQLFLIPPYVDVANAAGLACATGVATLVPWDQENEDTDGTMHSTSSNTSRIVLTTAGLYEIRYFVRWPTTTTGLLVLNLRLNAAGASGGGTSLRTTNQVAGTSGTSEIERAINYRPTTPPTDYVEVFVTHNSAGSQTTQAGSRVTGMQVRWISA